MKPILFAEGDNDYSTNGIGVLHDALNCEVFEEYNGIFDMTLEYPADGEWVKEIVRKSKILAKPNDVDEPHAFRIYEIEKDLASGVIFARGTSVTDDLGGNLFKHVSVTDATPQQVFDAIKQDLIEPTIFDFVSDIDTRSWSEWTRMNPLRAIVGEQGSIVDIWGGDVKRTNNTIYLYSRRGRDKVTTIRPGKNIDGFNMVVSDKGVITKILPFYTYTPKDIPVYQMEADGEGMMVKSAVYSETPSIQPEPETITGNVVVSVNADQYAVQRYTPVDYSQDDYMNSVVEEFIRYREEEADLSPIPIDNSGFREELKNFITTLLNEEAEGYFVYGNPGSDEPKLEIKTNLFQLSDSSDWEKYKDLENVQVSDTVDVYVKKFDADVEVTIQSILYDAIREKTISITAGSARNNLIGDINRPYINQINELKEYISKMENGVYNSIGRTADGQSRRFSGYTEPPAALSTDGDLWFKDVGNGIVETYMYRGGVWEPLINGAKLEAIEQGISDAKDAANDADIKAQDVVDDISDALVGTGKITLADLIASKVAEGEFETLFFQESKSIGLVWTNNGVDEAIIMINEDGVPYIKGENIILNGDTIVSGDFTVTDTMLANDAVIKKLMASGIDANDVTIVNLDASSITGGDLVVTESFRIMHNGFPVLEVDAFTGQVKITAPNLATQEDLQAIELTPGPQGIPGVDGEDGLTPYTHIAYADTVTGIGLSQEPVGKKYVGMYTDYIQTDSNDPALYKWSLLQGAKGDQGIPGTKGDDGLTPYFHTAWATNATGTTGFSTTIATDKTYLGTYTDFVAADSNDPLKYTWVKIQGPEGPQGLRGIQGIQGVDGDQGIPGTPGADGQSSYTHIAYSTSPSGATGFHVSDPVGKTHIGIYVDQVPTDSTDPAKYAWTQIKGADGANGLPGTPGDDGLTPYFHTAWANAADGVSGFSTTVSTGKLYLGTYTDYTPADSTNPSSYSWTLIKGDKGDTGTPGISVTSIVEEYYHSTSATTQTGGAWSTTVPAWVDGKYVWTRAKTTFSNATTSTTNPVNVTGSKGTNGVTTYSWVKYADDVNGAGLSDLPTGKRYIGLAFNKTTTTESTTPSDYAWTPLYDNVVIGGRNIFKVLEMTAADQLEYAEDRTIEHLSTTNSTRPILYPSLTVLEPGEYTLSFYKKTAELDPGVSSIRLSLAAIGGSLVTKSYIGKTVKGLNWQLVSYTFTVLEPQTFGLQIYNHEFGALFDTEVHIRSIMLERGNVPSEETVAPEDIDAKIGRKAETSDLDSLAGIVSDIGSQIGSKAEFGEFKKLLDEFDARVAQDIVDKDQLALDLATIEGRTAIVETIAGDAKLTTQFIDKVISQSEEGIFIANGSTSTGILISDDRISFIDNDIEVAYISNQTMQISHGIFVESATIGSFKFEKIPGTTILGITWVGV